MKCVHPHLNLAAAIAAMAFLSSASGCKNQQSAVAANPFLGPNRVPPPATRALLPGQAQPYYQGDPLPVSQNKAGQPAAVSQASAEAEMPSADGNLAWNSPSGALSKPNVGPASITAPPVSPAPSPSLVASNVPAVAVPADDNSLRFGLPPAAPVEPAPFVPVSPMALASTQAPTNTQPRLQLPSPPASRDILQAAYTEPVITSSEAPAPSPWRSPQVAQVSVGQTGVSPANYYIPQQVAAAPIGQSLATITPPSLPPNYAMPPVAVANTMDVRLREVPSPAMPRIRIPGYETSLPTVGNADGFRSRTSMR